MNHYGPFDDSRLYRTKVVESIQSLISHIERNQSSITATYIHERDIYLYQIRRLTDKEILTLKIECQCQVQDNTIVFLMSLPSIAITDVSALLLKTVKNCTFGGKYVIIGIDESKNDSHMNAPLGLPFGISNNGLISDCIIEPGVVVCNNIFISETIIFRGSSLVDCGSVTAGGEMYGQSMMLSLGPETGGGRKVVVDPEMTVVDIWTNLLNQKIDSDSNFSPIIIPWNIIIGNVKHCKEVENVFVSNNAMITNCPCVSRAILLPGSKIRNAIAENVYLQWDSKIINYSNVNSVLLMECSEIGPNSVVSNTVLGPDTHISCGEVHNSLIGPNTNAHHQSLIISALWPSGRGNVGYGSNIGSNHTGRLPDQEVTIGEGVFWGLGSVIKFPVDLSKSYYSIIAAGVTLPPQTVSIPFSLIVSGSHGNELVPGWLLESSPYTILRNEDKFRRRRRAKRHDFYCGWNIVRPTIIDACIEIRDTLKRETDNIMTADSLHILTRQNISQLGENYVTERGLQIGIKGYTSLIHRYALSGFLEIIHGETIDEILSSLHNLFKRGAKSESRPFTNIPSCEWPIMPWEEESFFDPRAVLDHKMKVFQQELSLILGKDRVQHVSAEDCVTCLKKLMTLENNHASQVLRSKSRDDKRGLEIIPGYATAHISAEKDSVVQLAFSEAERISQKCTSVVKILSSGCKCKL